MILKSTYYYNLFFYFLKECNEMNIFLFKLYLFLALNIFSTFFKIFIFTKHVEICLEEFNGNQ